MVMAINTVSKRDEKYFVSVQRFKMKKYFLCTETALRFNIQDAGAPR